MSQPFQKCGLEIIHFPHPCKHSALLIFFSVHSISFHILLLILLCKETFVISFNNFTSLSELVFGKHQFSSTCYVSCLYDLLFSHIFFILFFRLFIQFIFKLYNHVSCFYLGYFCHWMWQNVSQFCNLISVVFSPTDSNNCVRFLTYSYLICKKLIYGLVISVSVSIWDQGLRGVSYNIAIIFSWENIYLSTFSYFPDVTGVPNWTSWIWQESMQHTLTTGHLSVWCHLNLGGVTSKYTGNWL